MHVEVLVMKKHFICISDIVVSFLIWVDNAVSVWWNFSSVNLCTNRFVWPAWVHSSQFIAM